MPEGKPPLSEPVEKVVSELVAKLAQQKRQDGSHGSTKFEIVWNGKGENLLRVIDETTIKFKQKS